MPGRKTNGESNTQPLPKTMTPITYASIVFDPPISGEVGETPQGNSLVVSYQEDLYIVDENLTVRRYEERRAKVQGTIEHAVRALVRQWKRQQRLAQASAATNHQAEQGTSTEP